MKTHVIEPPPFEFCFPGLDTLVCVENRRDEVVIRATRDTFSEDRKTCFIHELAAEGFIPDDYQWFCTDFALSGNPAVRWLVDHSWCELSPGVVARTRRFMMRLLIGGALLWLLLMASLLLSTNQRDLSKAPHPVNLPATYG